MAFTWKCEFDDESCDEGLSYEEHAESYKLLYVKCEEVCKIGENQKKVISNLRLEKEKLLSNISRLQDEVIVDLKLENMTKHVRMLNNGYNVLDEILQVGKTSGNMKGIGFDYGTMNKEIKIPTKKFVSPEKKTEFVMLDHMSQHLNLEP